MNTKERTLSDRISSSVTNNEPSNSSFGNQFSLRNSTQQRSSESLNVIFGKSLPSLSFNFGNSDGNESVSFENLPQLTENANKPEEKFSISKLLNSKENLTGLIRKEARGKETPRLSEFEILSMPTELLFKILSFLDLPSLSIAGMVCKSFNNLAVLEFYDRGMVMMEVFHDNFGAIQSFTAATKINPTGYLAYFKRGVAYYKESEEEEALKDINKALSLVPECADAFIIKSMKHQIELDFRSAVEEASKAIVMEPTNGSAYYLRGYNRFDLQDYEGSIGDLSYCLALPYPYKSKVYNCRGWCYKIMGELDKALADFTSSSRLNVRYTKPFVNKAITLSTLKGKEGICEEETYLTEFLNTTKEGNLASVYYTRGAVRQQWENYEGAISDYRAAIVHNYHSIHKAYVSIGWCFEKLQKYDEAIKEYNKAILLKPNYSIAIEHRAGAKCRTDPEGSIDDCKLAIKTNPKNLSFAYRYLAAVMADNSDYDKAITQLNDGIKVNPLDQDMLINRAGYYTCLNDFESAIRDYTNCLKHRPDTFEAWKYRANAKYAVGQIDNSLEDFKRAMKLEPSDFTVSNNYGLALASLGQFEEAIIILQGALLKALEAPERDPLVKNIKELEVLSTSEVLDMSRLDISFFTDIVFEKNVEKAMRTVFNRQLSKTLNNKHHTRNQEDKITNKKRMTEVPERKA